MKQKNLPLLGAIYDLYMTTAPVASGIVGLFSLVTFYAVVKDYFLPFIPWMTLWIFLGLLAVVYLLGMLTMYLLLYASWFSFRNRQEARHGSLIMAKLAKIENLVTGPAKKGKSLARSQNSRGKRGKGDKFLARKV